MPPDVPLCRDEFVLFVYWGLNHVHDAPAVELAIMHFELSFMLHEVISHRACSFSLLYINCGRFGFVEFSSPDDAASAYDTMQNTEIDGRQVFLDFASPGMFLWSDTAFLVHVDMVPTLAFVPW